MTLKLKVIHGHIEIPAGVSLPEGTELEAVVLQTTPAEKKGSRVELPTFKGTGVCPGVDLHDNAAIRRILDESGKYL